MNTYKIIKINDNGTIDVSFSCDNKVQNLSGFPLSDANELDNAIVAYGIAYADGLKVEKPIIDKSVESLIGKVQEITQE